MSGAPQVKIAALIIEDAPPVADALAQTLERNGCTVREARSAGEGFRLYLEEPFSIVMVEEALPVLDGLHLVRLIRAIDQGTTLLMISGAADLPTAVSALRAGADDYVSRPFKLWDLKDRIHGSMSRRAVVARQARSRPESEDGRRVQSARLECVPERLRSALDRLRCSIERETLEWPGFFAEIGAQATAVAEKLSVREGDRRLLGQAAEMQFLGFGGEEPGRIQEAFHGPEELCEAWRGLAASGAALLDHMGPEAAPCAELLRTTAGLTGGHLIPRRQCSGPPVAQILWLSLLATLGRTWRLGRPKTAGELARFAGIGEPSALDPAVARTFLEEAAWACGPN